MDYQASKGSSKEIGFTVLKQLTVVFTLFVSTFSLISAQTTTTNPLSTGITISATVFALYPDTPPVQPKSDQSFIPNLDSAIFKGTAYQGSVVTLIQNGEVIATVPANSDGTFDLRIHNLNSGTYSFGIRAQDKDLLVSKLVLFTVYINSGITTIVDGIFVPPTITTDKIEVKKGDQISFSGTSVAFADVLLSLTSKSEILRKVKANASGTWIYTTNSTSFDLGDYQAKARTITASSISLYGDSVTFRVGDTTRMRSKAVSLIGFRKRCDLNNDNRVNLLDFSIMAFWYKRLGFPEKVDLNTDKQINLTDLSILAYCWTG